MNGADVEMVPIRKPIYWLEMRGIQPVPSVSAQQPPMRGGVLLSRRRGLPDEDEDYEVYPTKIISPRSQRFVHDGMNFIPKPKSRYVRKEPPSYPQGSQEELWYLEILNRGKVTCPSCRAVVRKTVEGLKKHMANCRQEPYTCHHCGKQLKSLAGMKYHVMADHNNKPLSEDGDGPSERERLRKVLKRLGKLKCSREVRERKNKLILKGLLKHSFEEDLAKSSSALFSPANKDKKTYKKHSPAQSVSSELPEKVASTASPPSVPLPSMPTKDSAQRSAEFRFLPSNFNPPMEKHVNIFQQAIIKDLHHVLGSGNILRQNLSIDEQQALDDLKSNSNIVILPADKGGAIVIMDFSYYWAEGKRQLSSNQHYFHMSLDPTPNFKKAIDDFLDSAVEEGIISAKTRIQLTASLPVDGTNENAEAGNDLIIGEKSQRRSAKVAAFHLQQIASEELTKEWPKRKVLEDLVPDDRKLKYTRPGMPTFSQEVIRKWNNEIKIYRKVQCPNKGCDSVYTSVSGLKAHLGCCHMGDFAGGTYRCLLCDKQFHSESGVKYHITSVHSQEWFVVNPKTTKSFAKQMKMAHKEDKLKKQKKRFITRVLAVKRAANSLKATPRNNILVRQEKPQIVEISSESEGNNSDVEEHVFMRPNWNIKNPMTKVMMKTVHGRK
ncbi:zinc finger protein 512 [Protopterus annectens]|uniref:zinc finger protein 512 n=1 Tax=Protopterus annectens TaxID=7888 RepID=UPI001CFB5D67|nr:zinc finger protein 512 [Protopterus annectens]